MPHRTNPLKPTALVSEEGIGKIVAILKAFCHLVFGPANFLIRRVLTTLVAAFACCNAILAQGIRVADHGAVVNDDTCDAVAIRAAIQAGSLLQKPILIFEAGVYNL